MKFRSIAVLTVVMLLAGCKAQTTLVEDVRDAKGVIDVAVKEWEAVPGTDEEKTMKGACASMLYDLQALAQSCLEDGPRWGDFEEQKSRDYVEDSQACNSQLNMK